MKNINQEIFFKELGKKITKFRKEQNLTQSEIAKKLNVTQQLIATYESGKRRLPILALFKIADILNVGADELLGIKSNKGPHPKILKRLEEILKLPLNKQKVVLELLDSFIKSNTKKVS